MTNDLAIYLIVTAAVALTLFREGASAAKAIWTSFLWPVVLMSVATDYIQERFDLAPSSGKERSDG